MDGDGWMVQSMTGRTGTLVVNLVNMILLFGCFIPVGEWKHNQKTNAFNFICRNVTLPEGMVF